MWSWLRRTRPHRPSRRTSFTVESLDDRCLPAAPVFIQNNLVSNVAGLAANTDPLLVNPWGLTASATSAFWVSDEGTGMSTLYNGSGQPQSLQVTIPTAPGSTATQGTPTGTVFNTDSTGFQVTAGGKTGSSAFLFDTLDGTISGWSPAVNRNDAIVAVDSPGSVFTGLAIGIDSTGQTLLYAADHSKGTIDVYNESFHLVTTLTGSFQDPGLPASASPFNIQAIGDKLYVEYTVKGSSTVLGAVDVFTMDGTVVPHQLIVGGPLDSPWGVTVAPANFGQFSNDILVGNFGNGNINAFDPTTNKFIGTLTLANGQAFEEDHLWALKFGNGAGSGPTNTLFFTAGINDEKDGLLGSLQAVPVVAPNAPVLANLPVAPRQTISTVPANGDQNPYGVAFVPQDFQGTGVLQAGDLLVSNFNNSSNVQGTGSTIVRITPEGQQSLFFQGSGLGLTTALGVLKSGFVVVGSLPVDASGNPQPGSLLILNASGKVVLTLTDSALLDGPWDLAINDLGNQAQIFVSNVLNGTITRIDLFVPKGETPIVESETLIASGFEHRTDPNALVVGPTGLALDARTDTLYVASTGDNAIFAIPNAAITNRSQGTGKIIYDNPATLHGPLGLVLAPNGDLIIANGDAVNANPSESNELLEITRTGRFVGQFQLDSGAPGAAFGLAITQDNGVIRFAAVDDDTNTVDIWAHQELPLQYGGYHHHREGYGDYGGYW